ncbi:MAG: hypothetical protein LBP27_01765 [Treponema sp.]|jgi:hypothetical protein|nr:hypothetical protein [Treponema sp.]
MGKDYVPAADAAFDVFFNNLNGYVDQKTGGNVPEWNFIPADDRNGLNGQYEGWHNAYAATLVPHTSQQTAEKNRLRKSAEKALRNFVNHYLRYPPVTDEDRDNMSIPNPDTTPTPVPPPTMQAEADIAFPGVHLVELTRIRAITTLDPDARSAYGVRIDWGILGGAAAQDKFRLASPPVTGADLPHSVFTRKKKHLFDFDGDSGKTVYFCLRYENAKGASGPFGPLFQAVIP